MYGLGIAGKLGARDVLRGILAVSDVSPRHAFIFYTATHYYQDLDQSMGLAGIRTISDCNRSMVRRIQYGGDTISSH